MNNGCLIEEYKSLRSEINQNSQIVSNIFLANITFVATFIGRGMKIETEGLYFLTPIVILIPSMFFISSKLGSTARIGSFMRIILEPQLEMLWLLSVL